MKNVQQIASTHSRGAPLYADVGAQRIKHPNTKSTLVVSRSPGALQCVEEEEKQSATSNTNKSNLIDENYLSL